jgi:hypothetical protein
MDAELQEFLAAIETRLSERIDAKTERVMNNVLHEMSARFNEVDRRFGRMESQLDQMNSRLERQGGLIQGGSRALTRLVLWSEDTDGALSKVLVRLGTVETRLDKLEGK